MGASARERSIIFTDWSESLTRQDPAPPSRNAPRLAPEGGANAVVGTDRWTFQ